jgi:hypothetical protein
LASRFIAEFFSNPARITAEVLAGYLVTSHLKRTSTDLWVGNEELSDGKCI